MLQELPVKFTETIAGLDAAAGPKWLSDLPAIVNEIADNWRLVVGQPYPNLSYHYVAPCICDDGTEAVLKVSFPAEQKTLFNEAKMLEFVNGNGLAKLLRLDEKPCALLLEKLTPGEDLKTICRDDNARAITIAIQVMRKIWREAPENDSFQKLEDWFQGFERAGKTEFSGEYLKKAQRIFEELSARSTQKMLLHGDLHHENILSAERESFLAIDPKGIVGNPAYETSTFLINHARWLSSETGLKEKLENSIRQFSEGLEIEPQIIRKWTFAQSVLSAWWTFEDNCNDWKGELAKARIWEELKL